MKNLLKKKSIFLLAAIGALLVSIFNIPYGNIFVWVLGIIGMFPMARNVIVKARLLKIDLHLPLIITLVILLFLGNSTVASIFLLLILLGGLFKEYISWRVEESIKSISKKLPREVLVRRGVKEILINIDDIKNGDIVIVKAGGRIPVDGVLLSQQAQVDESVVTGESKGIKKGNNENIIAGSILLSDYIEIKATSTSENSTVAQIEKLVRDSQKEQAKLSDFTSRYASYTIIFTLIAMFILFIIKRDILQALALWIALVPVIFAIIVPIATTIGISILAGKNVLVRHARALENLTKIDTVVFDKTGTVTEGKPVVTDIIIETGTNVSQKQVLQFTASLEKFSEHPFARAVISKAKEEGIEMLSVSHFKAIKGKGVSAIYNNNLILIGDLDFMIESDIVVSEFFTQAVKEFELKGDSVFFVAYSGQCIGLIVISDPIRDGVKEMVSLLHQNNINTVMLTGDNEIVAHTIAKRLHIEKVYAKLAPEDKNVFVKKFQDDGKKVLMVGDGINDAPALSQANVGLAMGKHGIGLTLNSADIILPHNDILKIPFMIIVAKRVFKIIKLDLWVATIIHVITAVFVVLNMVSVLGSTIMHQFSSLFVLFNTLRTFKVGKGDNK